MDCGETAKSESTATGGRRSWQFWTESTIPKRRRECSARSIDSFTQETHVNTPGARSLVVYMTPTWLSLYSYGRLMEAGALWSKPTCYASEAWRTWAEVWRKAAILWRLEWRFWSGEEYCYCCRQWCCCLWPTRLSCWWEQIVSWCWWGSQVFETRPWQWE
jgi:hypothetical protein